MSSDTDKWYDIETQEEDEMSFDEWYDKWEQNSPGPVYRVSREDAKVIWVAAQDCKYM
jgi:hypothetical protein